MTLQDAFDTIWNRAKIKIKSIEDGKTICLYRPEGKPPCFVGVLIEDQYYRPALEFQSAREKAIAFAISQSGYPKSSLYVEAQNIHDKLPPEEWEDSLRSLARRHNLTVNP